MYAMTKNKKYIILLSILFLLLFSIGFLLRNSLLSLVITPLTEKGIKLYSLSVTGNFTAGLKVVLFYTLLVFNPIITYIGWDTLIKNAKDLKKYSLISSLVYYAGAIVSFVIFYIYISHYISLLGDKIFNIETYTNYLLLCVVAGLACEFTAIMIMLHRVKNR